MSSPGLSERYVVSIVTAAACAMPLSVITMPAASPSGKGRHPSLIISPLGSGKVGLARADRHLRVLDVDVDPMRFAIEHRGRKPQEILVVQLLGHALEG